jgi:hypothetical protein
MTGLLHFRNTYFVPVVAGLAAATPAAVAGGTVNDIFTERERAAAMAFYVAMPLIGA